MGQTLFHVGARAYSHPRKCVCPLYFLYFAVLSGLAAFAIALALRGVTKQHAVTMLLQRASKLSESDVRRRHGTEPQR
jgi:hypothetical protein